MISAMVGLANWLNRMLAPGELSFQYTSPVSLFRQTRLGALGLGIERQSSLTPLLTVTKIRPFQEGPIEQGRGGPMSATRGLVSNFLTRSSFHSSRGAPSPRTRGPMSKQ